MTDPIYTFHSHLGTEDYRASSAFAALRAVNRNALLGAGEWIEFAPRVYQFLRAPLVAKLSAVLSECEAEDDAVETLALGIEIEGGFRTSISMAIAEGFVQKRSPHDAGEDEALRQAMG
jgi:hypothetical protein